ncbi:UNVERIFIED_CONTAM: Retrovirus-related Pol polyprotein from transposon [Sesamum radiatum]|uniref:Retrovirus-related Pol polyprotein from transposon n=1 Tax=Sesamum radiatum TaxID=300843 RepID=A0AAW2VQ62_SESRA
MPADPSKLQAMVDCPTPRSISSLHRFLGLTGYYRRFVHQYASIASPHTNLLRDTSFIWTPAADSAFHALKQVMPTVPTLQLPDFSLPFKVTTDASQSAVGAVLSQLQRPIAFFSKKMSPKMQSSSTYEREIYAITEAVHKWRHYLLGRRFHIYIDQKSLRGLLNQTIQTPAQHKWLTKLLRSSNPLLLGVIRVLEPPIPAFPHLSTGQKCSLMSSHSFDVVLPVNTANTQLELFHLSGTTLAYSSAYHPQSNGQTEVLNRVLETYLRCLISEEPRLWTHFLHLAEYWYNTSFHTSLGMTPFQIKQQADRHRQDRVFNIGDWVLLRLHAYHQHSVHRRSSHKLAKHFFGLFQIRSRIGEVAYELDLPNSSRVHPVFHVSLLKPFHGENTHVGGSLPLNPLFRLPICTPLTSWAIVCYRHIRATNPTFSALGRSGPK